MKAVALFLLQFTLCIIAGAQVNNTPNMNLPSPIPGVTSGPQWAQDIQSSFTIIDQHNHTPGSGVPIPPSGLLINTSFPFNNQLATNLQGVSFTPQSSLSTSINYTLYTVSNGDLYYNDSQASPNPVPIILNGVVNASSSGIASGTATASFAGSPAVLIVNSASSTPANIQGASLLLGNNIASSNYLTLSPPASMPSNISETLPAIPGAQSFMAIDSSGNMSAYAAVSGGITGTMIAPTTVARSNQVAVGQQISSSSGTYSHNGSLTAVTNLTVSITTSGRPVMVFLGPFNGASNSYIGLTGSTTSTTMGILIFRGAVTTAASFAFGSGTTNTTYIPSSSVMFMDTVGAGTYSYTIKAFTTNTSADTVFFNNVALYAYEL